MVGSDIMTDRDLHSSQKERNFNFQIFHGDPRTGSVKLSVAQPVYLCVPATIVVDHDLS